MAVKLGNGNWAVKEDKLLAYNDNSGLFFNKEFDFSRGTSATYVAKDGLIKTAGIQPNVVSNGDFSNGSTDWTLGSDWSVGDNKVIGDNSDTESTQQIFPDNTSRLLRITYTLTVDSGQVAVYMSGQVKDWKTASGTYTDTITTTSKTIEFDGRNADPFSGTITDIIVQEIQTDTPRIDFTNDTKGHLLLEPSRTNLVNYSEDFSQWTAGSNTSVTFESDVVAPDGSLGVYRLTLPAQSSTYLASNTFTGQNPLALSIYAKSVNTNNDFNFYDGNNPSSTKTATDEWQRFSHIGNGGEFVIVNFGDTFETDIYIWGAQAEAGDYITSIINTTGAASTRNADVCNNSGSAQDFNSEEGVLYAEIAALDNDGTNRYITISDGTDNNRIVLRFSTANRIRVDIVVSNSNQFNSELNISANQFYKAAFSYKQNEFKFYVDGVLIGSSSSGNVPSSGTFNVLKLENATGGNDFYGNVRNVQVFTEALTDEQLEKLTS